MSQRVTAKGGPLHGKTYLVADGTTSFPAVMGGVPGVYRVTAKQALWQPGTDAPAATDETEYGDALAALADTPAVKR